MISVKNSVCFRFSYEVLSRHGELFKWVSILRIIVLSTPEPVGVFAEAVEFTELVRLPKLP